MGVMDIVLDMNIYINMDKDMDIMWMKNRLWYECIHWYETDMDMDKESYEYG